MTTELEPGALEAARRAYDETLRHDDLGDADHVVRAYLSALSAPEAAHPGADAKPVAWWRKCDGHVVYNPWPGYAPLYLAPRPAAPTGGDIGALVATVEAELAKGVMSPMDWNTSNTVLVRKLLDALAAMSAKLADAERENKALSDEIDNLEEEACGVEDDIRKLTERAETAEGRMAEAEQREETWRAEVATAEAANADLRRRVDAMREVKQFVSTKRLEAMIGPQTAEPSEIHDMAVELILRRRASGGSDA